MGVRITKFQPNRPDCSGFADDRVRQRLIEESDEEAIRQQQKARRKKGMLTWEELVADCIASWERWKLDVARKKP